MKKFIPYEKMSKKARKAINTTKRATWGELNPITHKIQSKKIYKRQKTVIYDEQ